MRFGNLHFIVAIYGINIYNHHMITLKVFNVLFHLHILKHWPVKLFHEINDKINCIHVTMIQCAIVYLDQGKT